MKKNIKRGFTLAEVLIVLVILGVIAVMTIPSLIANANEQVFITGIKKSFATLNNAITLAGVEEGETPAGQITKKDLLDKVFVPTVKIGQIVEDKNNNGIGFNSQDGMVFLFLVTSSRFGNCGDIPSDITSATINGTREPCAMVFVDVNGSKGPNKMTKSNLKGQIRDQFVFAVYNDGVTPADTVAGAVIANGALKNETSGTKSTKPNTTLFSGFTGDPHIEYPITNGNTPSRGIWVEYIKGGT